MMMKRSSWGFLFDEKAIAVYSALIATPILLRYTSPYLGSLNGNSWIGMAILAFILVFISKKLMGKAKAAVFGLAAAVALNAFLMIPQLQRYTARLTA